MADDHTSPGAERAREASERFRSNMDGIRSRADATAKVFGGIAGAAIGGLGYARLADFFPYHGPDFWFAAAIGGVVLMLFAAGLLIRRFRRASYSVATSADPAKTITDNEINPTAVRSRWREWLESGRDPVEECKLVNGAYQAVATRNGKKTLVELEETGRSLEDGLEKSDGESPEDAAARADRILAEVQLAQDRAATFLLRRRSTQALFGGGAVFLAILFVFGWYLTAAGTDAIEAKRKDEVELTKTCAEILGKSETIKLPEVCEVAAEPEPKAEPKAAEVVDTAATTVSQLRASCRKAARAAENDPDVACTQLSAALTALNGGAAAP